jgi:penicillin-binding protein 2
MLGISFADHLDGTSRGFKFKIHRATDSTELVPKIEGNDDRYLPSKWKQITVKIVVMLVLGSVIAHVFTLQIVRGKYYKGLADGNGIVRRPIEASRGVITDRTGTVLVRNTPYVSLNDGKLMSYKEFLQSENALSSEQKKNTKIIPVREYQSENELSHILGYISPITQEEITKSKKLTAIEKNPYSLADTVGRSGLEEQYEKYLRGKSGTEMVEVNALGEIQRVLEREEAVSGYTLVTSLDQRLQKFSYQALSKTVANAGAEAGVVIIQNPKNGHILALVNFPSYNNNYFTHPDKKNKLETLFTDPNTPLLNRAISGTYPPGSTFKMVTALAGLEANTITAASTYEDTGSITISGITFNNWYFTQYGKNEGYVDVKKALARSNDTFFYKMALESGVERLVEQAFKFKFGQTLGIDIPGEAKGMIPTPEWKKATQNEVWYPGNTVNMSIGQGDVLSTPLQITSMTSAIANNGTIYPPSLVNQIKDGSSNKLCERDPHTGKWSGEVCESLNKDIVSPLVLTLKQENIRAMQEGMRMVAQTGGTAFPFFEFPIETAGKTGTAESGQGKEPHAWYTGYAPYNDPEITVTVLVENGGEGSKVAAPLVKEIMQYYFSEIKQDKRVAKNAAVGQ